MPSSESWETSRGGQPAVTEALSVLTSALVGACDELTSLKVTSTLCMPLICLVVCLLVYALLTTLTAAIWQAALTC